MPCSSLCLATLTQAWKECFLPFALSVNVVHKTRVGGDIPHRTLCLLSGGVRFSWEGYWDKGPNWWKARTNGRLEPDSSFRADVERKGCLWDIFLAATENFGWTLIAWFWWAKRTMNYWISSELRHSLGHFQAHTEAGLKSFQMETLTTFDCNCDETVSKLVFLLLFWSWASDVVQKTLFKHLTVAEWIALEVSQLVTCVTAFSKSSAQPKCQWKQSIPVLC